MLHSSTFDYLKPTDAQFALMSGARLAAKKYADYLDEILADGPDKDHVLRLVRDAAIWANICITRWANGEPK